MNASAATAFADDDFAPAPPGNHGPSGSEGLTERRWVAVPVRREGYSELLRRMHLWHPWAVSNQKLMWFSRLHERINALQNLPQGWDGPGSRPVAYGVASQAWRILEELYDDALPLPSLIPGGDGTLQIEWHCLGYDIEVDIRMDYASGSPDDMDLSGESDALYMAETYRVECFRQNIQPEAGGALLPEGDGEEMSLTNDFTALRVWIRDLVANQATHGGAAAGPHAAPGESGTTGTGEMLDRNTYAIGAVHLRFLP